MSLRRVIRPRPLRRGLRCASGSLATALLARHGRCCAAIRPVVTVMRDGERQPLTRVTHLHAATELSLAWITRMTPVVSRRQLAAPVRPWRPAAQNVGGGGRPESSQAPHVSMLERVFAREQRIERTAVHHHHASVAPERDPISPRPAAERWRTLDRIEQVVRKSVVVPPDWRRDQRDDTAVAAAAAKIIQLQSSRTVSSPPQPIALSPHEIGRLADDVLRQIDRRATSYRERMGLV